MRKEFFILFLLCIIIIPYAGYNAFPFLDRQVDALMPTITEIKLEDSQNRTIETRWSAIEKGTLLISDFDIDDDSKLNENPEDAAEVKVIELYIRHLN